MSLDCHHLWVGWDGGRKWPAECDQAYAKGTSGSHQPPDPCPLWMPPLPGPPTLCSIHHPLSNTFSTMISFTSLAVPPPPASVTSHSSLMDTFSMNDLIQPRLRPHISALQSPLGSIFGLEICPVPYSVPHLPYTFSSSPGLTSINISPASTHLLRDTLAPSF